MSLPNFFFDARFIRYDHHDGISRFSAGLFAALHARVEVTAIIHDLRQLEKLPRGARYILANSPTSLSEFFIAKKLNRAGAKFVFSPMQTMGSFGRKYRLVLTLHDLIYYRHPAPPPGFNALIRLVWRLFHTAWWPQRLILNRADAVATVSETTKQLIEQHRLTKRPVWVVYNAAGSFSREYEHSSPKQRPRQPQKLVYMGSFMPYKNVETLIAGMAHLPDYELHLLSKISPERQTELEKLIAPKSGRVVFHNGVSEAEYHRQLDSSVALVSASLDEGFGIPLVESMSRGVPVVVSKIDIFDEIGGSAALFFESENPADFAAQVMKLTDNPAWIEASRKSIAQAAKFDWNRSASELIRQLNTLA
jgi:glycosyltransferase involved in cell wall biosynthesis